jgi:hypothetical protein
MMQTEKNLLAARDIGSHINARRQAQREAGAQRRLLAVACTPKLRRSKKGLSRESHASLRAVGAWSPACLQRPGVAPLQR